MMGNLTYRQLRIIGIGICVLSILFSFLYLSQIIKLKKQYLIQTKEQVDIQNSPMILANQRKEIANLDAQILATDENGISVQSLTDLLQYLEKMCLQHQVRVTSLPTFSERKKGEFQIEEVTLTLEGSYVHILEALFEIETQSGIASIKSLDFMTEVVRTDSQNKKYLIAKVVLYRIKK